MPEEKAIEVMELWYKYELYTYRSILTFLLISSEMSASFGIFSNISISWLISKECITYAFKATPLFHDIAFFV